MDHLLFLAHRIPYPPDKGDKIRSFHVLTHLAKRFRVHLGCFVDNPADEQHVPRLHELCETVLALPLLRTKRWGRSAAAFLRGTSISEACFRDAHMQSWVRRSLSEHPIANAYVFSSVMAPYLHQVTANKILDMADVDSEKWRAYAQSAAWPARVIFGREQRQLLSLERRSALSYTRTLFVSPAEAGLFLSLVPEAAERVLPMGNGVDTAYFDPQRVSPCPFAAGTRPIVFTGMMDYRPNIEAVVRFAREILPLVRRIDSRAEFWIVGASPAPEVRAVASSEVHVTGRVPDVRPFLAHCACAVAPLTIARGVQNKVLEALAMGCAVVASPEACEGLDVVPEHDLLVAESNDPFAEAIGAVLGGGHPQLGAQGRQRVLDAYPWDRRLQVLEELLPGSAGASTPCRTIAAA